MSEAIKKYSEDLKTLSQETLAAELAWLIQVSPRYASQLECVVRELESRNPE